MKSDVSGKRKLKKDSEEKTSRKKYSPLEKAAYKAKKAREKMGKVAPEGKKWNTGTSKTVIRVSTKTNSTSGERTMVAPVAAFLVIDRRTVANPFRYQLSADEKLTPETRGNFVASFNSEDHRSPLWLIEARKEIYIK